MSCPQRKPKAVITWLYIMVRRLGLQNTSDSECSSIDTIAIIARLSDEYCLYVGSLLTELMIVLTKCLATSYKLNSQVLSHGCIDVSSLISSTIELALSRPFSLRCKILRYPSLYSDTDTVSRSGFEDHVQCLL